MVQWTSPWAVGGLVWLVLACDTQAHGIAACREVEAARCAAAVHCGYPDELQCVQFARDNCLHGTVADGFDALEVSSCRQAIDGSAQCALDSGPSTVLGACEPAITPSGRGGATVCDAILRPELLEACAFLTEVPPEDPNERVEPEPSSPGGDAGQ